ncbi:MAG: sulfatase [Alphaproteobacteria bacterium]|nr:sulfatase [Alphaproteobacteria bacterium]MCB9698334.1 sulfatase [Alphaproteobacteria bacterium]
MSDEAPKRTSKKKTTTIKVPDRTFRRLEERSSPTAPLPSAWASGLFLGVVIGLGAGAWDVALLQQAGLVVVPDPTPEALLPRVVAHAALGGALGLMAGALGLWSLRWATAATVMAVAWLASAPIASASAASGVPGVVGVVFALIAGFALSQVFGRLPAPGWLHAALSTVIGASLVVLLPFEVHLISSPTTAGGAAFALAVGLLMLPLAPLAALGSRDGRPPVVAALILLSTGVGAALATRRAPPAWTPTAPGPLVVVVAVDGLRADRVGGPEGRTPNLDRLARSSAVFTSAHATSNWSVPTLGSIMTARWPYAHGAGLNDGGRQLNTPLRPDVATLAVRLADQGWATAGVVSDPRLRSYGLDAGFQAWLDDPPSGAMPSAAAPLQAMGLRSAAWGGRSDAARVTDRAIALAGSDAGRARLLFVQYSDLAGPYRPGAADREAVGFSTRAWPADDYDAVLLGLDRELGRLIDQIPEDAWLVVTGTHGTSLGEQRDPALASANARWGTMMFEEQIRVPLLIRGPGVQHREIADAVSVADIPPTLLRSIQQGERRQGEEPLVMRDADGVALTQTFGTPITDERAVVAQSSLFGAERQAIIVGPLKLVRNGRGTFMYDLVADPRETSAMRLDGNLDAFARKLDAMLPDNGAGANLHDPPALSLQFGQIASRLWGGR